MMTRNLFAVANQHAKLVDFDTGSKPTCFICGTVG